MRKSLIKYAIQCSYYIYSGDTEEICTEWRYVGTEGKYKIFVFENDLTPNTKMFDTALEAGKYLDKHFGIDSQRLNYKNARIVEIEVEFERRYL